MENEYDRLASVDVREATVSRTAGFHLVRMTELPAELKGCRRIFQALPFPALALRTEEPDEIESRR